MFLFFVMSGSLAAFAIHRLASDRLRRAPAWDCGYPDANPATQYTAVSFAEPIRRVFGGFAFRRARDASTCRRPATRARRGSTACTCATAPGIGVYAPLVGAAVQAAAMRFNPLQFLTIRQYLTVVFAALVLLLAAAGGRHMKR